MTRWLALPMLALACAPRAEPPQTISVDPTLPEGIHRAVARAADAWCAEADRTGWCPAVVDADGEAYVVADHWDSEVTSEDGGGYARNMPAGWIAVSINALAAGRVSADSWTGPMLHEFGHFGIRGHVADSALMVAEFERVEDIPLTVDDAAVAAWCQHQGCYSSAVADSRRGAP